MTVVVRPLTVSDAEACDAIMRSLPDFFGHEGGLGSCAEAVRAYEGFAAERDGGVIGFATWERRTDETAEITWEAVHRDQRHGGVATELSRRSARTCELAAIGSPWR